MGKTALDLAYGGISPNELARRDAKFEQSQNPEGRVNLDALNRVNSIMSEAQGENEAREVVKAGGRSGGLLYGGGTYRLGSRDAAMNTDSVTRRSKWLAENVSTYQIENGRAVKINQKPSSPQAWAEVTGEHVFAPEHQAKAKELIQTLADKQGEREAEQKRMRNIKTAQRVIDTANSPKETQNRAA